MGACAVGYFRSNIIKHSVFAVFGSCLYVKSLWCRYWANSWIGENVLIINHEYVEIGKNVCVSQRAILCSGGHDYKSVSLAYKHSPIKICDGAWVCLDTKVLGGSNIGEGSVIAASEVVRIDIPDYTMLQDGQLRRIEPPSLP